LIGHFFLAHVSFLGTTRSSGKLVKNSSWLGLMQMLLSEV